MHGLQEAFQTQITVLLSESWKKERREREETRTRQDEEAEPTMRMSDGDGNNTSTQLIIVWTISALDHQNTIKSWFRSTTEKCFFHEQHF